MHREHQEGLYINERTPQQHNEGFRCKRAQVAKIMKVLSEREFASKISMGRKRASGVSCNKIFKTFKITDRQF